MTVTGIDGCSAADASGPLASGAGRWPNAYGRGARAAGNYEGGRASVSGLVLASVGIFAYVP